MNYGELIRLYFERSGALQWYWTVYVFVIGGVLAFSSLRQRKALMTVILISILYCCFAYKNLGAIGDVTMQRIAVLETIRDFQPQEPESAGMRKQHATLEPTLVAPSYEGIRNFHVACDLLTLATLWAMEWRRGRNGREDQTFAARAGEKAVT